MQNNRFVVLTGHLSNYPLSDLVGILRHQHKTGRLLIEYPKGPATFFFHNGELIDARMNELTGLQAICVAMAQPEAAFNFNPLIQTSRRSIENSQQRVVSELLGCWDESAIQIEGTANVGALEGSTINNATSQKQPVLQGRQTEPLALPPAPAIVTHQRTFLFAAAAVLIVIGISTVIAISEGFRNTGSSVSAPDRAVRPVQESQTQSPAKLGQIEIANHSNAGSRVNRSNERRASTNKQNESAGTESVPAASTGPENVATGPVSTSEGSRPQAIKVVMQIENGRVLKASIANHKSGMDSYEALALRIARQRRFPATTSGGQTVTISVNRPE
jgi:Domain of unknown function (DUF4388)